MTDIQLAMAAGFIVLLIFSAALAGISGRRSRRLPGDPTEARFVHVEERLDRQDHDLKNLRMAMSALPTKDTVNQLAVRIEALGGDMKAVAATTNATSRTVERIETFMLSASAVAIVKGARPVDDTSAKSHETGRER